MFLKGAHFKNMKRNRVTCAILAIIIMVIGIIYKRISGEVPEIIDNFIGDSLWALMIFFGFGFIFNKAKIKNIAFISAIFCFMIEFSQLYHAAWIDRIRANRLGGLILGSTFVAWDLPCYLAGIMFGVFVMLKVKLK